jgi:TetR/AcrR family transcriptional regulator, tetracycline repressor protein
MAPRNAVPPADAADAAPVRVRLSRAAVVDAALDLLDDVGLDGLTTRRLADRLGVKSASLYYHVRDKGQLLDLIAERIAAEIEIPDPALPWRTRLDTMLTSLRQVLLAHRDSAVIMAERTPRGPAWLAVSDAAVRALLDAGRSPEEAAALIGVLVGYVTGYVLDSGPWTEQELAEHSRRLAALPRDRYPALARLAPLLTDPDPEAQFRFGVDFLLGAI